MFYRYKKLESAKSSSCLMFQGINEGKMDIINCPSNIFSSRLCPPPLVKVRIPPSAITSSNLFQHKNEGFKSES